MSAITKIFAREVLGAIGAEEREEFGELLGRPTLLASLDESLGAGEERFVMHVEFFDTDTHARVPFHRHSATLNGSIGRGR